jgi:undecaprenyl-diphosphatase
MDFNLIIVSIIEGISEFLPVSSTAHLILTSKLLSLDTADPYIQFYFLFIQMGALLAGIVLFSKKVLFHKKILTNVLISFIPSAIIGFIFYKMFKHLLVGNMPLLALMIFLGGCIFIYLEKIFMKKYGDKDIKNFGRDEMNKMDALVVGVAQAIAIIPGVSRSGATIIAGIFRGVKKAVIVEYTFMLALPTLGAAVLYDAYKSIDMLSHIESWNGLFSGFIVSFSTAFLILFFLKHHLSKISLTAFGWYRIVLSIFIILTFIPNGGVNDIKKDMANKKDLPLVEIYPNKVQFGDPVFITINASSTPIRIVFDGKEIPIFEYKEVKRALLPISLEEKKTDHIVTVFLSNGMELRKDIKLFDRIKKTETLGIPESLGGNTKTAVKSLVNSLANESKSISNIKSEKEMLWSDPFVKPLKEIKITDVYGYGRDTLGYNITHKGTDFRAPVGTEVFSMNDGIVKIAENYPSYGNTIIIDHGLGINTLYLHLSEFKVRQGDKVKRGQLIGLSGDTGYAVGAHLHLSVKINGISIDPEKFMKFFDMI